MKIDRLLGIVIYLLNRDIVNVNTLADKFEVSSRTIQRDVETLNLAGIPITSIHGTNGGYSMPVTVSLTISDMDFVKKVLEAPYSIQF